jgi:transcriptional regulator with XRE-family HTH domain
MEHMSRPQSAQVAFGRNVRKRREVIDLTQEELAEKASLDRTYINDIERGARNLSLSSIIRIAKALGTTVSDLCHDID